MSQTPTLPCPSRRASELLLDQLGEPWSLARLASALGLSARTLNRRIRREFGTPPMALLRQARLAQARSELTTARPGATVTTVALDCGFAHLGRFSQEYARQFGERPSDTLRRARRRPAAVANPVTLGRPQYGEAPAVAGIG